ncbi:hypothetical protein [Nonomuraea sp. NPDC005650]|uniref:hypothetical protein n=1 Tax=Nonomuraea sp. NPDC005650 TaxID=3157045 RepID=UPI0033B57B98
MIDPLDPAGALAALRAVDWSRFDPVLDTAPLRDALAELERVRGVLQIFEVATGRCVNAIEGIAGGVGFPDYPRIRSR